MTGPVASGGIDVSEAGALALDAADPLAAYRDRFLLPSRPDGQPRIYLAGQSLGAEPRAVRAAVEAQLDLWARLGVDGHFHQGATWVDFDRALAEPTARLVGGRPAEVVTMNSLTVNLHLLMASLYRPEGRRTAILIDAPTFPSDRYAVESQLRHHGLDPATDLVVVGPRSGEATVRTSDLDAAIADTGDRLAMTVLAGVNYATGQVLEMARLTSAAHAVGAIALWDLAHAAGNVPLALHDWDVDAAVWCTYKYLNSGPGAVGQAFVHERWSRGGALPRLAGWWGNDPATRFRMADAFDPGLGADGWRLSNAPVLGMAPLHASLAIFDEVGLPALRAKSVALTGYLQGLLDALAPGVSVITPRDADARGCQLSLRLPDARERLAHLEARDIVADFREPDIIRIAPVPLYNRFHDAWTVARALSEVVA